MLPPTWRRVHIVHSRSAQSSVPMEVALYKLPMKARGRGACVKSFQTLLSKRKMRGFQRTGWKRVRCVAILLIFFAQLRLEGYGGHFGRKHSVSVAVSSQIELPSLPDTLIKWNSMKFQNSCMDYKII